MKFIVEAIRKWKNDFVIIVSSENGEILLATEDKIEYQVKVGEEVFGQIIEGIVHINDFANE